MCERASEPSVTHVGCSAFCHSLEACWSSRRSRNLQREGGFIPRLLLDHEWNTEDTVCLSACLSICPSRRLTKSEGWNLRPPQTHSNVTSFDLLSTFERTSPTVDGLTTLLPNTLLSDKATGEACVIYESTTDCCGSFRLTVRR